MVILTVRPFCEHFTDSTNHAKNTSGCPGRKILGESWMKLVLMLSNKTLSIVSKAAIYQLHSVMRKCFVHVTARKDIRQFPWHPRWLMFTKCTELLIKYGSFRSTSSVNVTWNLRDHCGCEIIPSFRVLRHGLFAAVTSAPATTHNMINSNHLVHFFAVTGKIECNAPINTTETAFLFYFLRYF